MDMETCTRPEYNDGLRDVFSPCLHGKSWKLLLVLYTRMNLETFTRSVYKEMDLETFTRSVCKDGPEDVHSSGIQGWTWRRALVLYTRIDLETFTCSVCSVDQETCTHINILLFILTPYPS